MADASQPESTPDVAATPRLEGAAAGEPVTDEAGVIVSDFLCAGCDYNLRTQPVDDTCPECGKAIAESVTYRKAMARSLFHLGRFSIVSRLGYAALGIALPMFCVSVSLSDNQLRNWQDGRWQTRVEMLYGEWPLAVFLPLLIYAMGSLGLMLIRPLEWGRWFAVRMGVYTGVVLALQYLFVLSVSAGEPIKVMAISLAGVGIVIGVLHGARVLLSKRTWPRTIEAAWQWVVLAAAIVAGIAAFAFVMIIAVLFAPAWTLMVFVMMTLRIRATQFAPAPRGRAVMIGVGWLAAYIASWAAAIHLAIEAYAKLPTSPPGCYIATAAARGHACFVGSRQVRCADGRVMWVNRQLRTCKVAELALAAVWPRGHRALRAGYDAVGPLAAGLLRHRLAADAAFVLITPAAWLAGRVLGAIGCDVEDLAGRVYPRP